MFVCSVLASCAASTHQGPARPGNVAAIRHEIEPNLEGRTITAMGRTRADSAVVFTRDASGARHEETWVRDDGGWKLTTSAALAAN